jgi:hypothetical protein
MVGHMVIMGPTRINQTSIKFNQLKQRSSLETNGESMKSQIFLFCHSFLGIKIAGNIVQDILPCMFALRKKSLKISNNILPFLQPESTYLATFQRPS